MIQTTVESSHLIRLSAFHDNLMQFLIPYIMRFFMQLIKCFTLHLATESYVSLPGADIRGCNSYI